MKRTPLILAAAALVIASASAWLAAAFRQPPHPVLTSAPLRAGTRPLNITMPTFSLSDQNNSTLSSNSMRGRVWIVDFIFTHCAGTCPKMTDQAVILQKQLTDPSIQFLSISVDPTRDDVATRKTYVAAHGLDESRWHFISPATQAEALRITQAMKIAGHMKVSDNPVLHSDRFILIDATNHIHGIYPMDDTAAIQRLIADANSLLPARR